MSAEKIEFPIRLFLLSIIIHIIVVFAIGDFSHPSLYEHQEIAENILSGNGFSFNLFGDNSRPTSQQAPGMAIIYAFFRWIFQFTIANALMMIFQAIMISLVPIFIFYGLRYWGASTGPSTWAAWLCLFHPNYLYAPTHIQVVNFVIFFVALAFMLSSFIMCVSNHGSRKLYAAFGFLCGIGMLFEPVLILLPVIFLSGSFFLQSPTFPKIIRQLLIGFIPVWLIVLTPWTIRNFQVHHTFVLVKSSFWYAFWQGNNHHSFGTDKLLPPNGYGYFDYFSNSSILEARSKVTDINSKLPSEFINSLAFKPEIKQFNEFKKLSFEFLAQEPKTYLKLILKRLSYFIWVDPTNPKSFHPVYWGTTFIMWFGVLLGFRHIIAQNKKLFIWIIIYPAIFAIFHSLTIYAVRFRMPTEWFFWIFWGYFLNSKVDMLRNILPIKRKHKVIT